MDGKIIHMKRGYIRGGNMNIIYKDDKEQKFVEEFMKEFEDLEDWEKQNNYFNDSIQNTGHEINEQELIKEFEDLISKNLYIVK